MAEPGVTPTGSPHILVLPWSCHPGVPPIRKQACLSLETQFRQRDCFQEKEEQMGRLGEQGLWVWGRGTLGPGLPGKGLETSREALRSAGRATWEVQFLCLSGSLRPRLTGHADLGHLLGWGCWTRPSRFGPGAVAVAVSSFPVDSRVE